ncbi:MAG: hypothetical protein H7Y32_00250, partial [Chloroflexales bacterium]|nr:hypothetical protein [Chloroflexales bacterium]
MTDLGTAHEQLPITLFDRAVLAVRASDGRIWLAFADLCGALELAADAQRRRARANEALHLRSFRVRLGAQVRELECLLLEDVPVWILTVQTGRVGAAARERFGYVKQYLVVSVQAAFRQLVDLPEGTSARVEDLADLDRIDAAFAALAALQSRQGTIEERQATLETSQDRARSAYRTIADQLRDLAQQVQELQRGLVVPLHAGQRGALYHAVLRWADARATAQPTTTKGTLINRCWAELHQRFAIARYTDLP